MSDEVYSRRQWRKQSVCRIGNRGRGTKVDKAKAIVDKSDVGGTSEGETACMGKGKQCSIVLSKLTYHSEATALRS